MLYRQSHITVQSVTYCCTVSDMLLYSQSHNAVQSVTHYCTVSHILLYAHERIHFLNIHNTILYMCWWILLTFHNFTYLLGVVINLYSFNCFASVHTRINILLFSHISTVTLSVLSLHINITHTRPQILSALCRCTQFVTYVTTALYVRSTVGWTAECELCRRIYLAVELR